MRCHAEISAEAADYNPLSRSSVIDKAEQTSCLATNAFFWAMAFLVGKIWPLNIAEMRDGDKPTARATSARVAPLRSIDNAFTWRFRRMSARMSRGHALRRGAVDAGALHHLADHVMRALSRDDAGVQNLLTCCRLLGRSAVDERH